MGDNRKGGYGGSIITLIILGEGWTRECTVEGSPALIEERLFSSTKLVANF